MANTLHITCTTITKRAERLTTAIAERTTANIIKIDKYGIRDGQTTFVSYTADETICDTYHSKFDCLADAISASQKIVTFKAQ